MIVDAGRWVLAQAVSDYRKWVHQGLEPPPIAVNISALELRQNDFVDAVQRAISEVGSTTRAIDLEITESVLMEDIAQCLPKLEAVRALGVGIALDDFGTGYSSLSYVTRLPVTALKIDRAFVVDMANNADSMTIVSAIISLSHSLNLKVIAEGVETQEQLDLLKLLKCDEMQGYLVSRPLPAELAAALFGAKNVGQAARNV
jgi:EAL domain-containing protein (putative c-di-GMP-specific phosphodiesterase class I)